MVKFFQRVGLDIQTVDDTTVFADAASGCRPVFFRKFFDILHFGQFDRFHNLTEHTVAQNHDGNTIFVGFVKSVVQNIDAFLHAVGAVNEHMIIAVSAALRRLEVVALCRLNTAESGAAPDHIDDYARKFRAGDIRNAFLFQRDSGA